MTKFKEKNQGHKDDMEFKKGNKKAPIKIPKDPRKIAPPKQISFEEIKAIRIRNKLTEKTFAFVVGVSPKTILKWENGISKPRGSQLRMLEIIKKFPIIINNFNKII